MKQKVRTRVLSAALTLVMLVSLVPTAFAAAYDDTGVFDSDLEYNFYSDLEDKSFRSLYNNYSYFIIESDDYYAPGVYVGTKYVDGKILSDGHDDDYPDASDAYADADDASDYYEDEYYDYTIYAYSSEGDAEADRGESKKTEYEAYITVRIYLDDDYSSSDGDIYAETDEDGVLDLDEIAEEIYDYANSQLGSKDYPEYVKFTSSDGDLYDDANKNISGSKIQFAEDGDEFTSYAYFEPQNNGASEISFVVTSYLEYTVRGTIVVDGDSSSSGDITYSCDYNSDVYFEGSDFEELLTSRQTLSYVTFTLPNSTKGTLYLGNSKLNASAKLDSDDLDEVSFTPKSGVTGNVSISFKIYYTTTTSSRTSSMSGTVVVSIDDGTTINYAGELDDYIEFDSDDFADVCYDVTGKTLSYVKFSLPTSSKGTLYAEYDGTSKGSTKAKSTDEFYVEAGKNDYALDDVVFVPNTSGTIELSYTGYNSKGTSLLTGKVKITVTAGTLSAINYTVSGSGYVGNSGVTFSASDFTAALKAKTSRALSYVTFTLPKSTEGTLYYNGSTKVTSSTQYKASTSGNSLDKVSFVPATGVTGSVTIEYTARDTSGNNYSGTVVVKTFVGQDTVLNYSTTGKAASFTALDFTAACFKKLGTTLSYVQFTLPSSSQGTLYYGYGTAQQTRVSATSNYSASTHLPYVSFLPKAGFSGTVTITYKGYDTTGGSYTGSIKVTVTPPTKSSYFTDVTESWAAPSVDFLSANSVYTGVFSGTTLDISKQVTRGEVMQMIYNAFNLKNKVSASSITSNFTDVPVTHPYYTAINACYTLGVAQGYDGKFSPSDPITRQDAITLLYRAFNELGLNMTTGTASDLAGFRDNATVSSYAVNAMASMIKSGIIQGDENQNINPFGNLSRGEISAILHRAMTL